MRRCAEVWSASLFALLFLSVGDSHARLPTPPQAQRDLLVLTEPAPQGSRVACWVPHFSKIIRVTAVGLPQECFLTTASVTGTNRKQREGEWRKRHSYQLIETQALKPTQRLILVGWSVEEHKPHGAFNLCFICNAAVTLLRCPQHTLRLWVLLAGSLGSALTQRLATWVSMRALEGIQACACAGSAHLCTPVIRWTHHDQMRARVALPR